jgi:hypothetical protein
LIWFGFIVFYAILNNISVISWRYINVWRSSNPPLNTYSKSLYIHVHVISYFCLVYFGLLFFYSKLSMYIYSAHSSETLHTLSLESSPVFGRRRRKPFTAQIIGHTIGIHGHGQGQAQNSGGISSVIRTPCFRIGPPTAIQI